MQERIARMKDSVATYSGTAGLTRIGLIEFHPSIRSFHSTINKESGNDRNASRIIVWCNLPNEMTSFDKSGLC